MGGGRASNLAHVGGKGDVPAGEVQGVPVEEDRYLFVEANGQQTLVVWKARLGFEGNALLIRPVTRLPALEIRSMEAAGTTETRRHIENLAEEPILERRVPAGDGDGFAVMYEVKAEPFK